VIDPHPDPSTRAIVEFNAMVLADDRVESVLLPIADGVTLARRARFLIFVTRARRGPDFVIRARRGPAGAPGSL